MRQAKIDKRIVPLDLMRKQKRVRAVIIIALVLVIALATAYSIGALRIRELREEMDTHITEALDLIDKGRYRSALTDAEQAFALAERLRDSVSAERIEAYIRLIESVLKANDLFDSGRFGEALSVYTQALDYALDVRDLGAEYIRQQIIAASSYVHFYELMEQAESFAEILNYDAALRLYEEARETAFAIPFARGSELAAAAIEDTNERIISAKRATAAELLSQASHCIQGGYYTESMMLSQGARALYQELGDTQGVILANARISYAERLLAEREQWEAEQKAKEEADKEAGGGSQGETGGGNEPGQEVSDINYDHNSQIRFDLMTLIDDQNRSPANQVRMGTTADRNEGWYNGCGWVATYNALILLGYPSHPADIVNFFETSGGTVMGGVFGTYPNAIESFLMTMGYNVNHVLFPQLSVNLDEAIKEAGVAILAYAHTRAAHYITVEYRDEDGRFIVYNDGYARARSRALGLENTSETGAVIDSVTALIRNTPGILFAFSMITVSIAPGG